MCTCNYLNFHKILRAHVENLEHTDLGRTVGRAIGVRKCFLEEMSIKWWTTVSQIKNKENTTSDRGRGYSEKMSSMELWTNKRQRTGKEDKGQTIELLMGNGESLEVSSGDNGFLY